MVRTKLPLMSAEATGTLGNLITFQRTKRGVKAYKYTKHGDAHSPTQRVQRSLFDNARAAWNRLSQNDKDKWTIIARTKYRTGYHAYVSYYLRGLYPPAFDGSLRFWLNGIPTLPDSNAYLKSLYYWHNAQISLIIAPS